MKDTDITATVSEASVVEAPSPPESTKTGIDTGSENSYNESATETGTNDKVVEALAPPESAATGTTTGIR